MALDIFLIKEETPNFFIKNWYYIGALTMSTIGAFMAVKNGSKKNKAERDSDGSVNSTISPTINVNVNGQDNSKRPKESDTSYPRGVDRNYQIDSLKSRVKILFIDDDTKFNVVKILKESGWKNTFSLTDLKSIDMPLVRESDIFFVDINGVGKYLTCEHEGLDIALMLKQKYPNKKVVIYSANKKNNAFHAAWDKCDFKLEKNALPYQFQSLVEQYSLELYK